jgi:hypothetical protein
MPGVTAAVQADGGINNATVLANAFGTQTFVGTYGFAFNGTTWDRLRTATIGNNVAATGITAADAYGQFNTVLPTITTGNYTSLQTDVNGRLLVATTPVAGAVTVVAGNLTNNNAAPAATNVGSLVALANAANPAWTEGDQVLLSEDLSGHLRVVATGAAASGAAAAGNPVLVAGKDFAGNAQTLSTNNVGNIALQQATSADAISNANLSMFPNASGGVNAPLQVGSFLFNGTTWDRARTATIGNNVAATGLAAGAAYGDVTTAAPTYTTGTYSALSLDTSGNLRVTPTAVGTLTNNNAAPGSLNLGVLPALANAANPAWTEGDQVLLSVDLSGHQRVVSTGAAATGAAVAGNPVYVAGKDGAGNVQPLGVAVITAATAPTTGNTILSVNNTTAPSLTTGQSVAVQSDYTGSIFVKPIRRSETAASKATITSSAVAVTVMPAQAAGIFADISSLVVTVTPAATVSLPFTLTLSDGTATYVWDMETGALATSSADGTLLNLAFNPPLSATTAATAWTIATNVATVTVHATAIAVLQKAS